MTVAEETEAGAGYVVNAVEAGKILGLSSQAVANRIKDGRIEAEKSGEGHGGEWRIPLREVYRDLTRDEVREEVRSETLQRGFRWFMTNYYRQIASVLEQADAIRERYESELDWDTEASERGDALEEFEKMDGEVAELATRVRMLQALRGGYPVLMQMAMDRSDLTGEAGGE